MTMSADAASAPPRPPSAGAAAAPVGALSAARAAAGGGGGGGGSVDDRLSSLLKSPHFSAASYINLALSDAVAAAPPSPSSSANDDSPGYEDGEEEDPDERLQRRMAELALRLQVTTQGCHDEIGRIGAELRAILPRCAADVGRLGVGLGGMRDDAAALLALQRGERGEDGEAEAGGGGEGKDVEAGGIGGGKKKKKDGPPAPSAAGPPPPSSLETLATLHALRSNLSLTRSILSAASSWDATLSSVPSLLSAQNLSEAVSALSRLESGERALRGMPGRSDRREAISKMRGRIEVLLKPQLLHALQRMDTRLGPLQKVAAMYGRLGKMDGLTEEYVRQRPGDVHRAWFDWAQQAATPASGSAAARKKIGGKETKKSAADELKFLGEEDDDDEDGEEEAEGDEEMAAPPPPSVPNPASFVEWLPEWYERVLSLLSEERRRSAAVFGADMAPEVIARVLMECFRPILPSFKTRLSAIHPPEEAASSSGAGSLESICTAFEATLQFLSLAYDQMVGFDTARQTDEIEAGGGASSSSSSLPPSAKSPVETYRFIREAFVSAASPFAPYQENFPALERSHTGLAARMVARDVQGAVSFRPNQGLPALLSGLQDAAERLGDLAPYLFPLAEGAVARFELLCCGYRAPEALGAVDGLLAGHGGELAIAAGTLTASVAADEDGLADAFDEQHVQCALEVLRVAGTFRRDLRAFEAKSRERLGVLHGRMRESVEREGGAAGGGRAAGAAAAAAAAIVPDSLSAVEVEAMLAGAVCGGGEEVAVEHPDGSPVAAVTTPSLESLRRLASSGADGALFPDSFEAAARLAGGCHAFVFDVCSAVPRRALRPMSSLPVWREESGGGGGDESYGILPQPYITQVGEHMLALVQALEPFASDPDALACASEAMGGVGDVAVQPWRQFASATGGADGGADEDVVKALMDGRGLAGHLLGPSDHGYEEEDELRAGEEEDEADRAVAAFCNEWLDVVGSAITGRLLERVMRIHHLSRRGCEHLAVDLNYLVNVFSALGVSGHPHPLLSHFAELAQMNADDLTEKIMSRDRNDEVVGAVRAAEVRIALMRGLSIH